MILITLTFLLLACQNDTPKQSSISYLNNRQTDHLALYYFQKDDLVGVKDEAGNVIIKPTYSISTEPKNCYKS